jgi:hypothetical protein
MNFKNARHGLVSNRVGYFVYRYAKLIQILPVLNNGTFVRKTLDKIGILWYNIRSKDLKDKSFEAYASPMRTAWNALYNISQKCPQPASIFTHVIKSAVKI